MPKRQDIRKILVIGSGPIVIGQACEFDYSGTQACKALREEGYYVILVNSNPASIMTDPEVADRTYIEPIEASVVAKIIERERPDALLPTLGGQVALNLAMQLVESGCLDKYEVKMIGANAKAIKKAEDREIFKEAMEKIGFQLAKSRFAYNMDEAIKIAEDIGFPCVIRPSYTLGGRGGGIASNMDEFKKIAFLGLESSRIQEISIEESLIGWKEYELEVMRDSKDNVVIVCAIENVDPVGVHTGDSITVAPTQTLSDKEYQQMRCAAIDIIREIGVETGGSNVQFALNPKDGRLIVIEMNPRVSRSSALASKATGFPIAKIAAKLAIGYTLDELQNDITRQTPASFEPSIDYCVIKIPRFTFEKFPEAGDSLGVSMKSVGETMAIGRNFKEALQKGLRGLEIGHCGLDNQSQYQDIDAAKLIDRLRIPNPSRIFYCKYALQGGMSLEDLCEHTGMDLWFLYQIKQLIDHETVLIEEFKTNESISLESLKKAKVYGFSDLQISRLLGVTEEDVFQMREENAISPVYKLVDTCAGEFEAYTPYYYSTYEEENEAKVSDSKKIMILGGGPNRIGQGIEFDYCCCHAAFALKDLGYESIMVNSNPETVSTDYDTSDRLYFEPLTFEDVMNIVRQEKPDGVIVQFGGQTPLNLAKQLDLAGVPILGTQVSSIEEAECRKRFSAMMDKLNIRQPKNAIAYSLEEAREKAKEVGFPFITRPSYVLGGRAMRIIYSYEDLDNFFKEAQEASKVGAVLIDEFLELATEVDVDALSDGEDCFVAGIMEHIEQVGIHSGDSACVLPTRTLSTEVLEDIRDATKNIAKELKVKGLLNIQFAVKNNEVYMIEVNPRASRTVPFVSKVTGNPLAKYAVSLMLGSKIKDLDFYNPVPQGYVGIKESVLPFSRFSGVDIVLGPEMKSTGEVMGIATTYGEAFAKAQMAAGQSLAKKGLVFVSVNDQDKPFIVSIVKKLDEMGFQFLSTTGTAKVLKDAGIKIREVPSLTQNEDNLLDLVEKGDIRLIINTPSGSQSQSDMKKIRGSAVRHNVPSITTLQGARAALKAIEHIKKDDVSVKTIQEYYASFDKRF
ncbi:carbamoyl phosphate synthase large subunit [PVC group bacterium (ex Bugula neritina AB1)]|nr:carbamoyl phosphate synthase large subunit [PVC group bacterium (ex Bugula neritina AB1)]